MQAAIEVGAIGQRTRSGDVTLRDVTLAVGQRELVAIIGGSGSGKTTLLDAMSGLRPPATGTVLLATSGHSAYVPGADAVHPDLPLARALRYTAGLRATDAGDRAVEDVLSTTGLAGQADTTIASLNAGQRKRAAIAAELLARPSLLFLEEPTTGLDPAQGTEVMRLLRLLCDAGSTIVLTTQNPLDAARCDKVAVLATGGHLAFFGTPEGALDYFAADSLDEIYERLAGVGDPAAAWSRRFFPFTRTMAGASQAPAVPLGPGSTLLLPDSAGPHSAGPVSTDRVDGPLAVAVPGNPEPSSLLTSEQPRAGAARAHRAAGPAQLAILATRNADILACSRHARIILAGVPVAIILAFLVLLVAGALDGPGAVCLAWALLAAFGAGLAYGRAWVRAEPGVLRRERFAGLSVSAFVIAKAVLIVPALAAVAVVTLAVPQIAGRLTAGFGPAYLLALLASVIGAAVPLAMLARQR